MTEVPVNEGPAAETPDVLPAETEQVAAAVEPATPGATLRRAREARGQSIADVVQVIRFSAHQIEALERDDYASLPGATSVRGLVRNYARYLKLDAAPLLTQLDPAVPVSETDVRPPTNMGGAEQPTLGERVPSRLIAGLRIEFDDRSWIEIRDATQKVVLVGEYAAGTRHNVDGKPPFQLWIGKASGVRCYMGERAIDLKPHTREEVARFTLD
jgi:cytoskeletal protein RodZ